MFAMLCLLLCCAKAVSIMCCLNHNAKHENMDYIGCIKMGVI